MRRRTPHAAAAHRARTRRLGRGARSRPCTRRVRGALLSAPGGTLGYVAKLTARPRGDPGSRGRRASSGRSPSPVGGACQLATLDGGAVRLEPKRARARAQRQRHTDGIAARRVAPRRRRHEHVDAVSHDHAARRVFGRHALAGRTLPLPDPSRVAEQRDEVSGAGVRPARRQAARASDRRQAPGRLADERATGDARGVGRAVAGCTRSTSPPTTTRSSTRSTQCTVRRSASASRRSGPRAGSGRLDSRSSTASSRCGRRPARHATSSTRPPSRSRHPRKAPPRTPRRSRAHPT